MIKKEDLKFHKDGEYISRVFLPLTPVEWFRCCTRDGDFYVGGCCGNMSYAQDLLNSFFRDGGWVDVRNLANYIEMMRSHDGFCRSDLPDPQKEEKENPLARIIAIWDLIYSEVKPLTECKLDAPRAANLDVRDAIFTLTKGAWALSWDLLVSGPEDFHKKRDTILNLMKIIPAFNVLSVNLKHLIPDTIEGVGIYKDGDLMETRSGYAIFKDIEEAEEVLKYWCKTKKDRKQFNIKPVALSLEKGIQEK